MAKAYELARRLVAAYVLKEERRGIAWGRLAYELEDLVMAAINECHEGEPDHWDGLTGRRPNEQPEQPAPIPAGDDPEAEVAFRLYLADRERLEVEAVPEGETPDGPSGPRGDRMTAAEFMESQEGMGQS